MAYDASASGATGLYNGLAFSFSEMLREITSMAAFASKFLTPASQNILSDWRQELVNFQNNSLGNKFYWQIPKETPLETIPSTGDYEVDGHGKLTVYGQLSGVWKITTEPSKKSSKPQLFLINGLASTKASVFICEKEENDKEIAQWNIDVGDTLSPGCHFHIQVTGDKSETVFFLPVPRFPCFLVTPMDALEFLLAELFQTKWHQHAAKESNALNMWAGCQRKRMANLLAWKREEILNNSGSPWTTLKLAKPMDSQMLLKELDR